MDYIDLFQVSDFVDIAFVLLVITSSIRSLIMSPQNETSSKNTKELKEVEIVLKNLLDEAQIASSNLNKELLLRKKELESLLEEIEEKEEKINTFSSSYLTKSKKNKKKKEFELENLLDKTNDFINLSTKKEKKIEPKSTHPLLLELDQITINVFKRLIKEGSTLSKIAKTLDLPIAQVRILKDILDKDLKEDMPLKKSVNAI